MNMNPIFFPLKNSRKKMLAFAGVAVILSFVFLIPLRADKAPLEQGLIAEDLTVPKELLDEAQKLSLEEATRIAVARNLNIQISRLEKQANEYDLPIAQSIYDTHLRADATYSHDRTQRTSIIFGSREIEGAVGVELQKLLPTGTNVEISGSTVRNSTDTPFSTINPSYESIMEIAVQQPLLKNFFGYLDRKEIQKVKLDVKKFRYEKLDEIEREVYETRLKYWELVSAYWDLEARYQALRKAQDFYRINQEKLDLGLVENPDIHAAEANVRKRVIEVWEAATKLYASSYALKVALNNPEVPLIQPETEWSLKSFEPDYEEQLRVTYENRWDLKQLSLNLEQRGIDVKIAKNAMLPELDFEGSYVSQGLDINQDDSQGEVFGFHHPRYFAGFQFSMPLEMREERGRYGQSQYLFKAAEKTLDSMRLAIAQEFDDSYRELQLARYKVKQTEEIEKLERKKLEEEEKDFNRGRSSSDTIIDFQEDLIAAERGSIAALVEYYKAVDRFYRTQNRLLQYAGLTLPFSEDSGKQGNRP